MGYKIRFGAWQRQNTSPLLSGEDKLQAEFCIFLEKVFGEYGFYSVPNGTYKSKRDRKKFKATGLKSGVPDLHIPSPIYEPFNGPLAFLSLYIETKVHGKYASQKQRKWHTALRAEGHLVEIVKEMDALQELICTYYPDQAKKAIPEFKEIHKRSRYKF